ncbi:MAG: DUF547 domain-containing protein [Saprospiraceae bacterium]|nr:DUF547 domain-containing protein [Saprospiraceae bacterium]
MRHLILVFIVGMWSSMGLAQPDYKAWDVFLKKYVSASGDVDYKSIKSNKKSLDSIVRSFSGVTVSPTWSKNDQLAFWINAYNAFTIDLIVNNYPLKSIQNLDGGKPWDVKRITIGSKNTRLTTSKTISYVHNLRMHASILPSIAELSLVRRC